MTAYTSNLAAFSHDTERRAASSRQLSFLFVYFLYVSVVDSTVIAFDCPERLVSEISSRCIERDVKLAPAHTHSPAR